MGPFLRDGAWVPVVLLVIIGAYVWSRILPSDRTLLGTMPLPNFWWQLGSVVTLALVALFCGWLQGVYAWYPPEVAVEPLAHDHGHHREHGHADGHGHQGHH